MYCICMTFNNINYIDKVSDDSIAHTAWLHESK